LHWHGDTFDLPPGATHVARSEGCRNQAFTYDAERVIGLQFHFEWTRENLEATLRHCGDELTDGKYVQSPEEMLRRKEGFEQNNKMMDQIAGKFLA
jgi:GMP synthase (glutamine-hydrolysing)